MKTIFKRIFPILIALAMVISIMPLQAFATTVTVLDGKISITDTASNITASGDTVTATAKGGYSSQTTNTLIITNASDSTATIAFDYSASNYSSFLESAATGTKTVVLGAGESIKMSITGKKAFTSNTATLKLSNFVYEAASASANITINFDSAIGSVTAEGALVSNGDVIAVDDAALDVVATPATGYSFYAWVNADTREVLSSSATYNVAVVKDVAVEAVFSNNSSSKAYFYANNEKYLFDDLTEAGQFAAASTDKTIVLMASGTLTAAEYTIPAGVTLLIPFDDANTLYTSTPSSVGYNGIPLLTATANQWQQPYVYRKLTMASGANISVNGAISLSAKHSFCQGGKPSGGAPSGPCSYLYMNENSSITVNKGGALYAWGYIYGKGSVTAKSGANVYENFQIEDFRGGTQSTKMENGVFPTAQYYIQNIEVPLTIEAGAYENSYTSIFMSKTAVSSSVKMFSTSDAMFNLTSGSVTKWYDGTTDRLNITLNEDSQMTVSPVSLKISTSTIDSEEYELPINGNITITAKSGSKVYMEQDIAMLPGAVINFENGAYGELLDGINIYLYDIDDWGNYIFRNNKDTTFSPITYAPGKTYTRTEADLFDATVRVDGTFDATKGHVYTTLHGANIYSTGTGIIKAAAGTEKVTYQLNQQDATYAEIPIIPAVLQNADGATPSTGNDTYTYTNGKWICSEHTPGETVVENKFDATCDSDGSYQNVVYCDFCGSETSRDTVIVDATGHTWDDGKITTEPTCEAEGVKTYTCACGETKTEAISATGHSFDEGKVTTEPTCEAEGVKTYTCACGETKTEAISAMGHNYNAVVTEPTCDTAGYTTHTCANCGDSYVADETEATGHTWDDGKITTEPTCEAEGVKTYSCACGETKTEAVSAMGHNYNAVVTDPTCTTAGYTTHTCGNCGDSYVSDETKANGHTPGAEANCTDDQICTVCGEILDEANGHDFSGEWIIEALPTYSADGCKYHICLNDGCEEKGDVTVLTKHTTPDINSDGVLDAEDLATLKKIVLGIDLVETNVDKDIYETIMDLNDDGKINVMDLIRLKRKMLEL